MADSRFKPGDRVVHVATNSTFIVREVVDDQLVFRDHGAYGGFKASDFRLAAHPWASELRKYNLVDTELDGTELEGHPFRVVDGLIRAITTEGERGPGDDVDWACNEIEEGYTPTEALC
jgi:hypothetical protein